MTRFTKNMTMVMAALAMTAGAVSAQTMRVEIPFAFSVGKQVMQPGEYRVSTLFNGSGAPIFRLANYESSRAVIVLPSIHSAPSKEWMAAGLGKLSFACSEGPCALTRLWTGDGDVYNFHSLRGKNGELHITEIAMRRERGD